MVQIIELIFKIFENNGIELIGSLLLATTIGLFYTKSNNLLSDSKLVFLL